MDTIGFEILKQWVFDSIGEKLTSETTWPVAFKSGVLLCQLLNKHRPGLIKKIHTSLSPSTSKENIGSFIRACQVVGLKENDVFEIADLYDDRNISKVLSTLNKLQKVIEKVNSEPVNEEKSADKIELKKSFLKKEDSEVDIEDTKGKQGKSKLDKFKRWKNDITSPTYQSFSSSPSLSHIVATSSPPLSASDSFTSDRGETYKLKNEVERLQADRKTLKERVAFNYPEKYRNFTMFDDVLLRKEEPSCVVPPEGGGGMLEREFLKSEGTKLLTEIFTLTSISGIVEENRSLRIRMEELQKMVDAMAGEKKALTARIDEMLASQSLTSDSEEPEEGVVFSDYRGKGVTVMGGTTEKLIERLFNKNITGAVSEYVDIFLLTYRAFTTWKTVLGMLTKSYYENRVSEEENAVVDASIQMEQQKLTKKKLRLRVCNFLKRWVEDYFADFDADLIQALRTFIDDVGTDDQLVVLLKRALERKLAGVKNNPSLNYTFDGPPPSPILPLRFSASSISFEDLDVVEVARQITISGFDMYRAITPKEVLSLSWTKADKEVRSPNVIRGIQAFNSLNNYVVWNVVREQNIKKRAVLLKKFIALTEELRKLNNFSGVFALVSALRCTPVSRLKRTLEEVSKTRIKQLDEYEALISSGHNYSKYRAELHNANPPCLPYTGVFLTDLTFIDEGNPDLLANGFVNFFKCRMVAETIEEIKRYQQAPYNLQRVPLIIDHLINHRVVEEKELYSLSLQAEPREISQSQGLQQTPSQQSVSQ